MDQAYKNQDKDKDLTYKDLTQGLGPSLQEPGQGQGLDLQGQKLDSRTWTKPTRTKTRTRTRFTRTEDQACKDQNKDKD